VAVEFALISPIFIFLICISLEIFRIQIERLLIQRSIYSIVYEAKTAINKEQITKIAESIIEKRRKGFFQVNTAKLEIFSSAYFDGILSPVEGSGNPDDISYLKLTVNYGLFNRLPILNRRISNEEVHIYYYINEPGI
jgi:hypothetical protein